VPFLFAVGLFSAALQSVYFREYLSVFSGNELSVGMILSAWVLAAGAGTVLGSRATAQVGPGVAAAALAVCAALGITAIRASRLVFLPGELLGPLQMLAVIAASECPFSFANGLVLGALFSRGGRPGRLYGWENAGTVTGALCVFAGVLVQTPNSLIAVIAGLPLLAVCRRAPWAALVCLAALAFVPAFDRVSVQWKYDVPAQGIIYGHEGEILPIGTGSDTTFLQNGTLYKSTMQRPFLEQAVHIPMGERMAVRRALVVFDRGQAAEIAKYTGCSVDVVETEPAFARQGGRIAAVETFRPRLRYDIVFLGTGIPRTAASNRFYTRSFLSHVKTFLADSGLVTFTLPFSENYLSPAERKLYNALYSTLGSVFPHVLVFPGEGYTFMASDKPLSTKWSVRAPTEYLSSSIVPAVSDDRIQEANRSPASAIVNTSDRPVTLLLGLQSWIELFGNQLGLVIALLVACFCVAAWLVPRTRAAFSVGTSGLVLGAYSVAILLLYQSTCGALYSHVSLLLVALAAGFAAGSLIRRLPFSDLAIGAYCACSLALLALFPSLPPVLFYLFHAGAGVLCGGQIVSKARTGLGDLYAADLFGGALGMALCSTLLIPLFGILPVAIGMGVIKVIAELAAKRGPAHFTMY
jgi:spermidine synthase